MAIAKMKKMTLLAEQANKDSLLKAIQELQGMEIIPVSLEDEESLMQMSDEQSTNTSDHYEEKLQDVRHALDYVRDFIPEPGMIQRMKKGPEDLTLSELEEHVEQADINGWIEKISQKEQRLEQLKEERKKLLEEEQFLRRWSALNFHPEELKSFRLMHGQVGTVNTELLPEFKEALNEPGILYFEEIFQSRDTTAYLVLGPTEEKDTIRRILDEYQFTALEYTYEGLPAEELKHNLSQQDELRKKRKETEKELKGYKKAPRDLELAEEYYYNLSQRETAKSLLADSSSLFIVDGWLEEEKIPELKQLVNETVGEKNVAIIDEDVKMEDYKSVPIVLKNNALVAPFETVTEMYSLPQYDEIDPTPLMMPFYVIFFGMMSADLGYGLILFLATLAAIKFFNLSEKMEKNLRFFNLASVGTIIFGLIFGSLFGAELPFALLSIQDDVIPILVISVVLGFIQMMTGLITNGIVKRRQGQKASSYIDGYAWAMILVGIALWLAGSMLLDNQLMSTIGIGLAVLNVIGILLVSALASKNKVLGFALGGYNLYGISGYVGDLVSYTRLMALAVSSASIGLAFNMIIGFLPGAARFTVGIVLALALHSLNLFLTYLSAYVHTARLQYVEFFGKFFEGGGRPLNPLKTLEKHVSLKKRSN